ncbi:MAG TPA: hypothetical protein VM841_08015 [Actinomycetota bacterium]|nr:hypothetical protein [Actinomycetota bacterium]
MALVYTGAGAQHQSYTGFGGHYTLGLGYMAPPGSPTLPSNATGIEEPVFGLIVCENKDRQSPTGMPGGGAGGQCPSVTVGTGDKVQVFVQDIKNGSGEVSFAACVDTDYDGNCRPEDPDDYLHFYMCSGLPNPDGRGHSRLSFTHNGPPGPLAFFMMQQVDQTGMCGAVEGYLEGFVLTATGQPPQCSDGRDNDGNGIADWPNDPGCSDPNDDFEWVPPPGYTH